MRSILGQVVRSFFEDHLSVQKGLRPGSIRSYRDTVRLFLGFVSREVRRPITRLSLQNLTFERTLSFLKHLEVTRGNHVRTRNQRLAALKTFFEYVEPVARTSPAGRQSTMNSASNRPKHDD